MAGHYEVRDHTVNRATVLAVWWVSPEPGTTGIVFTIDHERLPLLAEALAEYLAGHPPCG
jgi:hypothetical protein